jgi:hypothetical protein
MAHKFKELQKKISAERRARVGERVREAIKKMALDELRTAREFTQAELSQVLRVDQGSISKLERRTDMYIGTLRRYIEAMGGAFRSAQYFLMARCKSPNLRMPNSLATDVHVLFATVAYHPGIEPRATATALSPENSCSLGKAAGGVEAAAVFRYPPVNRYSGSSATAAALREDGRGFLGAMMYE